MVNRLLFLGFCIFSSNSLLAGNCIIQQSAPGRWEATYTCNNIASGAGYITKTGFTSYNDARSWCNKQQKEDNDRKGSCHGTSSNYGDEDWYYDWDFLFPPRPDSTIP